MKVLQLNPKTVGELASYEAFPAITFYMPIHSTHSEEVGQDKIRLKNLIQRCQQRLEGLDYHFEKKSILDDVEKMQEQHEFWKTPGNGLAIFVSEDVKTAVILPESVDESMHVGEEFLLSPLLGMLMENQEFYVAAISRKSNHLFHGDRFSLEELEDTDLPGPLEDELGIDEYENEKQHKPIKGNTASFHGHGGSDDGKEAMRENYFRMVARVIDARLKGIADKPLIIAGVEQDVSHLRTISSYGNIVDGYINGNFEKVDKGELHKQAVKIIESHVEADDESALEEFYVMENKEPEKTATNPQEIAEAASNGRVGKLFVAFGEKTKDNVKKTQQEIARYFTDASKSGEEIDRAVITTWKNGGVIVPVTPDVLSERNRMAAVYRF